MKSPRSPFFQRGKRPDAEKFPSLKKGVRGGLGEILYKLKRGGYDARHDESGADLRI